MTDRETLIALFDRARILWAEDADVTRRDFPHAASAIRVGTQGAAHPGNDGYTDFYTAYVFDAEGRLLSVGAWE